MRLLHNVLWESPHSRRGERKLCSEFQDVLSESLVDVGYFDGKQSIKMSLMSKQDIAAMYKARGSSNSVFLLTDHSLYQFIMTNWFILFSISL